MFGVLLRSNSMQRETMLSILVFISPASVLGVLSMLFADSCVAGVGVGVGFVFGIGLGDDSVISVGVASFRDSPRDSPRDLPRDAPCDAPCDSLCGWVT